MLKNCFFILQLLCAYTNSFSQTNNLDQKEVENWPRVSNPILNASGAYYSYHLSGENAAYHFGAVDGSWKDSVFLDGKYIEGIFSDHLKLLFYRHDDSVVRYNLVSKAKTLVCVGVSDFGLVGNGSNEALICYSKLSKLLINFIVTDQKYVIDSVISYNVLKSQIILKRSIGVKKSVDLFSLYNKDVYNLWMGDYISNIIVDTSNDKVAFWGRKKAAYNLFVADSNALTKGGQVQVLNLDSNISKVARIDKFSIDGNRIFLSLNNQKVIPKPSDVIISRYSDNNISLSYTSPSYNFNCKAVFNILSHKLVILTNENEVISSSFAYMNYVGKSDKYIVIESNRGNFKEDYWNRNAYGTKYVVSTIDGERVVFPFNNVRNYWFSPNMQYVVYYDPIKYEYYTFEISTGKIRNISFNISENWSIDNDEVRSREIPKGVCGFIQKSNKVLVYGQEDIYSLDMSGFDSPCNLTNGFGKKNKVVFRFLEDFVYLKDNAEFVLNSFDLKAKKNGFYKILISKHPKDPDSLHMGDFMYCGVDVDWENISLVNPVKAKFKKGYIVRRMSAEESENYFYTETFKTFQRISHNYPERKFNWIKSALLSYEIKPGKLGSAILYYPQNFDSTQKYPVIFRYYERNANGLHEYHYPGLVESEINVPLFVSKGFIICIPDIYYDIDFPGRSALECVEAARKCISSCSWYDHSKLGLQGHSFGGFETNYIITHSNEYAAACSLSGIANYVSLQHTKFESNNTRIRKDIWAPGYFEIYKENSPVYLVENVQTPVLLMANKKDKDVADFQGIEFFIGLRRFGKKSWLLQYPNGDHSVTDEDAKDLTFKIIDFFSHFLKGEKSPSWMNSESR